MQINGHVLHSKMPQILSIFNKMWELKDLYDKFPHFFLKEKLSSNHLKNIESEHHKFLILSLHHLKF